ncbi:MAG TPA: MFS transporter, partial [Chloroflexota bacterium]|nr:MFS transporter [Chloroflexota bacterium]
QSTSTLPRIVQRFGVHYAWVVVILTFFSVLAGAGIRAAPPILIVPFEHEFGWSRADLSQAVSLNLLMYGIGGPLAGKLIELRGVRFVQMAGLILLGVGVTGTLFMSSIWQLNVLWGLIVGLGAGGAATVSSAAVATRWFVKRRGLASGILTSGVSMGQLIFYPSLMAIVLAFDWRVAATLLAALAFTVLVPLALFTRNDPSELGLLPYGADEPLHSTGRGPLHAEPRVAGSEVIRASTFWLLFGAFSTCGATTAGLIGTHLIPHAVDHGISPMTAASTIGMMGFLNFFGTIGSGWLTDRMDPRKILAGAFLVRGSALLMLPVLSSMTFFDTVPGLFVFGVIFGLDWLATGPPLISLIADRFGRRSAPYVFGWVFLGHQIGSSLAAWGGGFARVALGDYGPAFFVAGLVAFGGAILGLRVRRHERPLPVAASALA